MLNFIVIFEWYLFRTLRGVRPERRRTTNRAKAFEPSTGRTLRCTEIKWVYPETAKFFSWKKTL